MPIYEYFCNACQTQSEINHRMSDPPATICPVCGKPELTKQISAAAFRLKGGGWYETDFKTDAKKNVADSDSGGAIAPVAGVAAGGSKPAATPGAKSDSAPAPAAPAAASPAPSSTGPSSTT